MERKCGNKKARVEEPLLLLPNVQVKQEVPDGGEGAVVVADGAPGNGNQAPIHGTFDPTVLHCPVCSDRLRPPVFKCAAGLHKACISCQGKLPGKRCHSCDHGTGGGAYVRCHLMDDVVCSFRVQCAHHQHGCTSYVAYFEAPDHESACPRAPCSCTEPGCGVVASPPNLLGHLVSAHSWPVHGIRYRTDLSLGVRASEPRVLLVTAEEDGGVFLLSLGTFGSAMAVSVVCLRANGGAGQQYGLKLWAHGSGGRAVMLNTDVTSSAAPGNVDVDADDFLTVPPTMMTGPDKEMVLTVCIDEAGAA
uniref:Uncharacterized protein n=2 Tax=Avena sativa TaxID=4498 RepID=A0ACD5Y2S8_AVESA